MSDLMTQMAQTDAARAQAEAWRARADTYWIETARVLLKADRDEERPALLLGSSPQTPIPPEKIVEYAKKLRTLMGG